MIHFFMLFYILLLYEIYSCWFIMEINDDSQLLARIVEGPTKLIEAFFFFFGQFLVHCVFTQNFCWMELLVAQQPHCSLMNSRCLFKTMIDCSLLYDV